MPETNILANLKYTTERKDTSSAGNRDKRLFAIIRFAYLDRMFKDLDYIYKNRSKLFSLEEKSSNKLSRESIKKDLNLLVNENLLQKGTDGQYYPSIFTNLEFDLDAIYSIDATDDEINVYFFYNFTPTEVDSFTFRLINIRRIPEDKQKEYLEKMNLLINRIKKNLKNPFINHNKIKQILTFYKILKQDSIKWQQIQGIIEGLGYTYSDEQRICIVNYIKSKNPNVVFN